MMATFRVWAPHAQKVDLVLGEQRLPMQAQERGWFIREHEAQAGDDYAFSLDGEDPMPDPRSAWQPQGVHGPSRLIDHEAFAWTDQQWTGGLPLGAALIYEMHVGTFTPRGTFVAAIERLDHLVDLGVTHVELMPVATWDGLRGWGYDGVDLFAPHSAYGEPDDLKRLVDACHQRGLAVLLDVVYNHLGPVGNYLEPFGPYFSDFSSPWGKAINFGGRGSDEVRRFFIGNALMWMRDYHFDGLRLDAVHAYVDPSATHFLEQLADEVRALEAHLGRHMVLIAESDLNDPRLVRPVEGGGYGLDAQWNDDFRHSLHTLLTGEDTGYHADFGSVEMLATALHEAFVYAGQYSCSRGRCHGRPAGDLPGYRFLGYLQNHDQVGNRAAGERSSHLLDEDRLKLAALIIFTSPFVPMLFMGEEWAARTPFMYFTSFNEPELAKAIYEGRSKEFAAFGWDPNDVSDPQDEQTFARSKLDWDEMTKPPHADMLDWHRRLARLRRQTSALSDGRLARVRTAYDEAGRWLVYQRGPITVAVNFHEEAQRVPLTDGAASRILLTTSSVQQDEEGLEMPPYSGVILGPADAKGAVEADRPEYRKLAGEHKHAAFSESPKGD